MKQRRKLHSLFDVLDETPNLKHIFKFLMSAQTKKMRSNRYANKSDEIKLSIISVE